MTPIIFTVHMQYDCTYSIYTANKHVVWCHLSCKATVSPGLEKAVSSALNTFYTPLVHLKYCHLM